MAAATARAAEAADRSADAARSSADAARRSAEVQELERLRATEVADIEWTVPEDGPVRVVHVGTTPACNVWARFEMRGERFAVSRERVDSDESVPLPTEDELPEGEIQRRAVLIVAAQHHNIRGFPGGTVRVRWESPRGSPGYWTGELPADPLLTMW